MKTIDHNPNEPERPLRGEHLFVTVVTASALIALGFGLKLAFAELGYLVGFGIGGAMLIALFLSAFAWERWKSQRRG